MRDRYRYATRIAQTKKLTIYRILFFFRALLLTVKKEFFFSSFQTDYANPKITQETEFFFKSKGSVVLSGMFLIILFKYVYFFKYFYILIYILRFQKTH